MIPFAVTPDPDSVVAGWIPVVLIAVLALAMVVLYRSLRKQMRKIDIPDEGIPTHGPHAGHEGGREDGGSASGRAGGRTRG